MELNKIKLICGTIGFCVFMFCMTIWYAVNIPYEINFNANDNFKEAMDGLEFNQISTLNDYSCQDKIHREIMEQEEEQEKRPLVNINEMNYQKAKELNEKQRGLIN